MVSISVPLPLFLFRSGRLTCLSSSIQTQHQNTHFLGTENLPHNLRDLTTHFAGRDSATPERVANNRVFGRSESDECARKVATAWERKVLSN